MPNLSDLIGGGGGAVELGSNYASGSATATIVSSVANTNGVELRTVSLTSSSFNTTRSAKLKAGGNIILQTQCGDSAAMAASLTNILVPAGDAVEIEIVGSVFGVGRTSEYHITYEVL